MSSNNGRISIAHIHDYGINLNTREIYLHSHISDGEYEEPGVDYRMSVRFEKNMRAMNICSKKHILVHMHTIGGEWPDGMGIYDCITFSRSAVTILGYGHIGSMSSIIFQSADKRVLMPNAEFMIHYGSMSVDSNSISAKSAIEQNDKMNQRMLDIYCSKCKECNRFSDWSEKKIKSFLDRRMNSSQEWYMNAEEAVEFGFADSILGDDNSPSIEELANV